MKVVQFHQTGGPERLVYEEAAKPQPGEGEILVRLKTVGVNYIDLYQRSGLYDVDLPFIPGKEGAGIVEDTGKNVTRFKKGDQVVYALHNQSYAEYTAVAAGKAVLIPDEITFEQAVAVFNQGLVAHYLCNDAFRAQKGQTALVHAAAGGVGSLLVQMLKCKGVTVFGTASTQKKLEFLEHCDVDFKINYFRNDFENIILKETAGAGVDVVYDSVGKTTFEKSLRCLKVKGSMISFGQSSGPVPPIDISSLRLKSLYLTRPMLPHFIQAYEILVYRAKELFNGILSQSLKPKIDNIYSLAEAWRAHQKIEKRETLGKSILIP